MANEIVDGGLPYVDAVERKPPLLFWTYAAVFKIAGKFNWPALHAFAVAWTLCTMAGLYVIGSQLFNRNTGVIAALLYSLFQPWVSWKNLALDGEMLMNLPLVWAWAIAFRRSSSRLRPELFLGGALLCAGFLLKQPAALAAVPVGLYLLLPSYRTARGLTRTASIIQAAILTAGFLATLGLVTIVLIKQGILRDAFYWTIVNHTDLHIFWQRGVKFTSAFVGACLPLLIGAALAYRNFGGIWEGKEAERTALLGLTLASAVGVIVGGRYYPHYYVQLIPPLALLAAPHYSDLFSGRVRPPNFLLRPVVMYIWLGIIALAFPIAHWRGLAAFRELREIARYLRVHSLPQDRIFVWGQQAEIYAEAERRPACRYIVTFPLTGFDGPRYVDTRRQIMPGAWETLERDFAQHPPVYIVDVAEHVDGRYPARDFPVLAQLLAEKYEPVAQTAEGLIYRIRANP